MDPSEYHRSLIESKSTQHRGPNHVDIRPRQQTWLKDAQSRLPLRKRHSVCERVNADFHSVKPRTPRRKLNDGQAFEDMQIQTMNSHSFENPLSFSSVGTPSHHIHQPELTHHMFGLGPDIDFGPFDTFLDLPTPKSAEMPNVTSFPMIDAHELEQYQIQPTLIRTTSVEQEGLSLCFEQTHLGGQPQQILRHVPPSPFGRFMQNPIIPPDGIFDHNKLHELENMFDYEFNETDIDKEVDSFYLDAGSNDLDIDLIT
jgi:hypothetical protein